MDTLPIEVLSSIIQLLPDQSLAVSCLVCKKWNMIISDNLFWKQRCVERQRIPPSIAKNSQANITFRDAYKSNIFRKNLLKNGNATEKCDHWQVDSEFVVEELPAGGTYFSLPVNDGKCSIGKAKCWTNGRHGACKSQLIDLSAEGAENVLMDELQHPIEIEDWYAGRFKSGSEYRLKVDLYNKDKKELDSFQFEDYIETFTGKYWRKVSHRFVDYPSGVRYIIFTHWAIDDYHGCKVTSSSVRFAND